jgi:hypothetical protein
MFQIRVLSVSSAFCMLQVLYVNVSKVDRVLRMGYAWEAGGDASSPRAGDIRRRGPRMATRDVGEQRLATTGPCMDARKQTAATGVRTSGG